MIFCDTDGFGMAVCRQLNNKYV